METNRVPTVIRRVSSWTHQIHERTLVLDPADLKAWESGALIQDALSYLPPEEREFIMSGITPEEWKDMFPEEDNE